MIFVGGPLDAWVLERAGGAADRPARLEVVYSVLGVPCRWTYQQSEASPLAMTCLDERGISGPEQLGRFEEPGTPALPGSVEGA